MGVHILCRDEDYAKGMGQSSNDAAMKDVRPIKSPSVRSMFQAWSQKK